MMKILLLLLVGLLSAQDPISINNANIQDTIAMDGPLLAEQAKENEKEEQKLDPFISEEFRSIKQKKGEMQVAQSFLLTLLPEQIYSFRFNIQSNPSPQMAVTIYTQESGDDIAYIKNHEEDNYLNISISTALFGSYNFLSKVYVKKYLQLGSFSGSELFIQLQNKFDLKVIVEVSLNGPPSRIDRFQVADNSLFSIAAKKIEAILNQLEQIRAINRYSFKFEWGFLQREQHYEAQMLKLVGFQSIIILVTAVVQMYCIRHLFDNKAVI